MPSMSSIIRLCSIWCYQPGRGKEESRGAGESGSRRVHTGCRCKALAPHHETMKIYVTTKTTKLTKKVIIIGNIRIRRFVLLLFVLFVSFVVKNIESVCWECSRSKANGDCFRLLTRGFAKMCCFFKENVLHYR